MIHLYVLNPVDTFRLEDSPLDTMNDNKIRFWANLVGTPAISKFMPTCMKGIISIGISCKYHKVKSSAPLWFKFLSTIA